MKYYLKEEFLHDNNVKNAGNKARNDVESIVRSQGFEPLFLSVDNWYNMSIIKAQIHKAKSFRKSLNRLNKGDELLIQFPMLHHSFFTTSLVKKARKRGVKIYFIIHDLDALRFMNGQAVPLKHRIRMKIQESGLLGAADGIIAHNPVMKSVLVDKGIDADKIVSLGIFYYLIPNFQENNGLTKDQPIIVAGNLAQEKACYLYTLPKAPDYNLYGVGFDESRALENETYFGSFLPDELPAALEGGFGLVWDGDSAETCSGVFGEYLRYNNSHKASLYLASGFPLVVWEESALSTFVLDNHCGIAVGSLSELAEKIKSLSDEEYQQLVSCSQKIGKNIRAGYYLKTALKKFD